MKSVICVALFMMTCLSLQAANPDDIIGIWFNEEGTAKIEIYKIKDRYYGKIVWLKDPVYTAQDVAINAGNPKVQLGSPRVDWKNPDADRQNDPIMGLVVLRDLLFDEGGDEWNQGMIYDPKKGSDYKCYIKMIEKNKLKLRGYYGFSLIGRTTYWTRA